MGTVFRDAKTGKITGYSSKNKASTPEQTYTRKNKSGLPDVTDAGTPINPADFGKPTGSTLKVNYIDVEATERARSQAQAEKQAFENELIRNKKAEVMIENANKRAELEYIKALSEETFRRQQLVKEGYELKDLTYNKEGKLVVWEEGLPNTYDPKTKEKLRGYVKETPQFSGGSISALPKDFDEQMRKPHVIGVDGKKIIYSENIGKIDYSLRKAMLKETGFKLGVAEATYSIKKHPFKTGASVVGWALVPEVMAVKEVGSLFLNPEKAYGVGQLLKDPSRLGGQLLVNAPLYVGGSYAIQKTVIPKITPSVIKAKSYLGMKTAVKLTELKKISAVVKDGQTKFLFGTTKRDALVKNLPKVKEEIYVSFGDYSRATKKTAYSLETVKGSGLTKVNLKTGKIKKISIDVSEVNKIVSPKKIRSSEFDFILTPAKYPEKITYSWGVKGHSRTIQTVTDRFVNLGYGKSRVTIDADIGQYAGFYQRGGNIYLSKDLSLALKEQTLKHEIGHKASYEAGFNYKYKFDKKELSVLKEKNLISEYEVTGMYKDKLVSDPLSEQFAGLYKLKYSTPKAFKKYAPKTYKQLSNMLREGGISDPQLTVKFGAKDIAVSSYRKSKTLPYEEKIVTKGVKIGKKFKSIEVYSAGKIRNRPYNRKTKIETFKPESKLPDYKIKELEGGTRDLTKMLSKQEVGIVEAFQIPKTVTAVSLKRPQITPIKLETDLLKESYPIKAELDKRDLKIAPIIDIKPETKDKIGLNLPQSFKVDNTIKPDLKFKNDLVIKDLNEITPTIKTEITQDLKVKPDLRVPSLTKQDLTNIRQETEFKPPFIIPELPSREKERREESNKGFNVYVKEKKKFIKVNQRALSRRDALALGGTVVNETTSATFKLQAVKKKPSPIDLDVSNWDLIGGYFNQKEKNKFIEKNKFRINTIGEFNGITVKGWLARRRKSKGWSL